MPNFTLDQIREIMDDARRIRNISVIAHVDHGKSTLTDSLIAKAGIISGEKAGEARFTDTTEEEQSRGITISSTGVSLYFESKVVDGQTEEPYLVNLIDSPGHVDFSGEVTAALRVTDGALVVVDYVEGVCVQTETVLRQALAERVKPVLMINKVDRGILELKMDAETIYQQFQRVIEQTNVVIASYDQESQGQASLQVDPTETSVAFGSGYFGWAFTISQFARVYAKRLGVDVGTMTNKLWGDVYYNPERKCFQSSNKTDSGKILDRTFVQFILKPILRLTENTMQGNMETVQKIAQSMSITIKQEEMELKGKDLYKCVFQKWLPASDALIEMIVLKLPSPHQAQAYRAAHLYEGPIDDQCGSGIVNCDKEGPLMVYISKMVPTKEKGRFFAFGRVFSGTVRAGQPIRVMGPNYKPGSKTDLQVTNVQRIVLMMGRKQEAVTSVPCGNTVGLYGIDKHLVKQGTLSDNPDAHCIKAMKYSVSPVVRVSVAPLKAADLPKFIEGLRMLSKSDPLVQCYKESNGENIVAGSGELHVEICLKALEQQYAQVPMKVGEPVVQYMETVTQESSQVCMTKSQNKHNRLFGTLQPLGEELYKAIDEGHISSTQDVKERNRKLVEEFDWEPSLTKKIWCFGPEESGPNLLVDQTKAVQYLTEIRDSVQSSFQWFTREGVLAEEGMQGVQFNLLDASIHRDSMHRGGAQVVPAARRLFLAGELTAEPRFKEPIFLVEVQCTDDSVGGVYQCISQRRGTIVEENAIPGQPLFNIKAYLPVAESFGFTQALRAATSGKAFPQCTFDHWEMVSSSPFEEDSRAFKLAAQIRARKGLNPHIPSLDVFNDKL